jgi:endo-1,3-1,4-beta-glycanase ExoK
MASYEHPSQQAAPPVVVPPVAVPPEPAEAATAPGPKFPQMGEAFVERFDGGSLDEERWYISDGWSNGDWMENDWRRSQVSMTPDDLRITLERGPSGSKKLLAGGEVQSRQQFRYGYFEVRMRVPRGEGLIAGAFTYVGPEGGVKPHEIDIEILGKATRRVELTIHEKGQSIGKKVDLAFDAAEGFYSYAFDWQPEYVRWYVEGVMIHEERGSAARRLVRPQKFFLVQWGTRQLHQWAGAVDVSQGPWTLDVACVAYAPTYAGKPLCD